jgi:hypothetical protein
MNLQKNQRPVAPTGYPSQYPSNAFVMTPGVAPQYQYRPASYPYGQSQVSFKIEDNQLISAESV